MNKNKSISTGGSIGLTGIILAVLIALKIAGVIDWSWWIVLMPLWVEIGLVALVVLIIYVVAILKKENLI